MRWFGSSESKRVGDNAHHLSVYPDSIITQQSYIQYRGIKPLLQLSRSFSQLSAHSTSSGQALNSQLFLPPQTNFTGTEARSKFSALSKGSGFIRPRAATQRSGTR